MADAVSQNPGIAPVIIDPYTRNDGKPDELKIGTFDDLFAEVQRQQDQTVSDEERPIRVEAISTSRLLENVAAQADQNDVLEGRLSDQDGFVISKPEQTRDFRTPVSETRQNLGMTNVDEAQNSQQPLPKARRKAAKPDDIDGQDRSHIEKTVLDVLQKATQGTDPAKLSQNVFIKTIEQTKDARNQSPISISVLYGEEGLRIHAQLSHVLHDRDLDKIKHDIRNFLGRDAIKVSDIIISNKPPTDFIIDANGESVGRRNPTGR